METLFFMCWILFAFRQISQASVGYTQISKIFAGVENKCADFITFSYRISVIFGPVVAIIAAISFSTPAHARQISWCLSLVSDTNVLVFTDCLWHIFRLEKEYTTIKTKEMEEQVEIKVRGDCWVLAKCPEGSTLRILFHVILFVCLLLVLQRLRTENRLLKQRIDTLEKVSASAFVTGAPSPDKPTRRCSLLISITLTHSAVYAHTSCISSWWWSLVFH